MSGRDRHRHHANPFTIRGEIARPNWQGVFGRTAPLALDIGFGIGGFLLELARTHPEWNVLGLEIRPHLIADVQALARAEKLPNVAAMLANANVHLDELLPNDSVIFAALNFPDPWYKKRHQKRRVMRPELLSVLAQKLCSGGELHAMSDFAPIAHEIRDVVEADGRFVNLDGRGAFATASTTGIVTEREIKHQGRGEPIYRLRFRYCPIATS